MASAAHALAAKPENERPRYAGYATTGRQRDMAHVRARGRAGRAVNQLVRVKYAEGKWLPKDNRRRNDRHRPVAPGELWGADRWCCGGSLQHCAEFWEFDVPGIPFRRLSKCRPCALEVAQQQIGLC